MKHTTYIYKGRRVLPERMCKCKKYTQEEVDVLVKQAEEKGYNDGYENAKFQYTNTQLDDTGNYWNCAGSYRPSQSENSN